MLFTVNGVTCVRYCIQSHAVNEKCQLFRFSYLDLYTVSVHYKVMEGV